MQTRTASRPGAAAREAIGFADDAFVCIVLGWSLATLRNRRSAGTAPPSCKVGNVHLTDKAETRRLDQAAPHFRGWKAGAGQGAAMNKRLRAWAMLDTEPHEVQQRVGERWASWARFTCCRAAAVRELMKLAQERGFHDFRLRRCEPEPLREDDKPLRSDRKGEP